MGESIFDDMQFCSDEELVSYYENLGFSEKEICKLLKDIADNRKQIKKLLRGSKDETDI